MALGKGADGTLARAVCSGFARLLILREGL
jgi:hypothetical protein